MAAMDPTRRARKLRRQATDAETKMWHLLRNRQLRNAKFRRQHPIGHYVADFVCVEHTLIVEIDGGQHASQTDGDVRRTAYLNDLGYTVVRYWNNEVLTNPEGVLEDLAKYLE